MDTNSSRPRDEAEANREQRDEGQAQDVAADALRRRTDLSEDSEHGGRPNPAQVSPDDTPDLVDRMNEMDRSGRIDMDAYAGEEPGDDEEDALAQADLEEDDEGLNDFEE